MRRTMFVFLLTLTGLTWNGTLGTAATVDESAAVIDLCGDWAFAYSPAPKGLGLEGNKTLPENPPPQAAFIATMPAPGCWDDQFTEAKAKAIWPEATYNPSAPIVFPTSDDPTFATLPFLLGTGWYCRTIDVPAEWKGRQVTLNMPRVVMEAWVYVNGRQVHHHQGYSTNWEVSLTDKLEAGKPNQLVIAVDNTQKNRGGCNIMGFAGRSAGIFGPVSLRVAGRARIADLFVYPDNGQLHWRVETEGPVTSDCEMRWRVVDPRTGRSVDSGQQPATKAAKTQWTSGTKGIEPWSDRQPNLYQLEVELRSGESCLDVRRQSFGRRRLIPDGMALRLNGHPVFLRGNLEHGYYPLTCTLPIDRATYLNQVACLKQLGFNWLRFHTTVPLEPFMEAADELGMMIQVEPPRGYSLEEWHDIVRACRKHPSVVIYCCGNEELLDEAKIEFLRQCAAELKAEAPDALFNPQEALRGVEYHFPKADTGYKDAVQKPYPHNPVRLAKLKEFCDVFGQYTWGWLSYFSLQGEPEAIDRRLAAYERPCLTHELSISGCYIDLSLEKRYEGTRIGTGFYRAAREAIQRAGLLDRAETYYRNSATWQRLIYKDALETARSCHLVAGYDFLGATDLHHFRTGCILGMMNEFSELKWDRTIDDILQYNGESVLLIDQKRERNLAAGQPFERNVLVSWFGEGTLRDATLRWSLTTANDQKVLASGTQAVGPVESGKVERIGAIETTVPNVERPIKTILTVELAWADKKIRNQWEHWIFPAAEAVDMKNVNVVASLDEAVMKKLVAGQRVLLLGATPFPAQKLTFQIGVTGRPKMNQATVIAKHPLMDHFPNDGYCGWQFYKMFTDAAAVQLDAMSDVFDPIVEIVGSFQQPRRQAAVFEWRVGEGRLLVCSLKLPESDSAAAYFHRCLLKYAAGDAFQPHMRVAPERLAQLLKHAPATVQPEPETDHAYDPHAQLPKDKEERKP